MQNICKMFAQVAKMEIIRNQQRIIITKYFILSQIPLGIINGGKIVKTGRSDLKITQKCKICFFVVIFRLRTPPRNGALNFGLVQCNVYKVQMFGAKTQNNQECK